MLVMMTVMVVVRVAVPSVLVVMMVVRIVVEYSEQLPQHEHDELQEHGRLPYQFLDLFAVHRAPFVGLAKRDVDAASPSRNPRNSKN